MTSTMRARPGTTTPAATPRHPAVFAWQEILAGMGMGVTAEVLYACCGGCRYVPAAPALPFGGYEAAMGCGAALGFYCDDFRSRDPHLALAALRAQDDLLRRRWRALPMFGFHPERIPGLADPVIMPVVLRDLEPDSIRVTSIFADRVIGLDDYVAADLPLHGYAALTPALRAIVAPAKLDLATNAARALRTGLRRQLTSPTGLPALSEFLATNPTATRVAAYRDAMWAAAGGAAGDSTFFRDGLVATLRRHGTDLPDRVLVGFAKSAALHAEFLGYDASPSLLREIADTERAALVAAVQS